MPASQERHSYETSLSSYSTESPLRYHNARQIVESHLGTILHTEAVTGGLVSYVYRVTGETQRGIVKVRGSHLAKLPEVPIDPKDVDYEWKALQILSQVEPSTFPQPLAIDRETSMLLMSDVIPDGRTLERRLEEGDVTTEEAINLGSTVARVHRKLAPFSEDIREGGDEAVYGKDLRRRIHQKDQGNPILDEVVVNLANRPKQLILGDLAPKNIGKGSDGQVTICDLESFYRGDLLFAYGYLAGHILIHTLNDQGSSDVLVESLLAGYKQQDTETDFEDPLLQKIALGAALYRLDNTVVPYTISLSAEVKQRKAKKAYELLAEKNLTWPMLIRSMVAA